MFSEELLEKAFLISLLENCKGVTTHARLPHQSEPSPQQLPLPGGCCPAPLKRPVCGRGQSRVPSGAEPRSTPSCPFTGQLAEGYKGRLCSEAVSQHGDLGTQSSG